MPTIAEPTPPGAVHWPPSSLHVDQHREALLADMREAGVRITPASVLRRALEVGVPEHVAVQIADQSSGKA